MIRILLVDDHKIVRDGMKSILALLPGEFELLGEAATGREAIAFLERQAAAGQAVEGQSVKEQAVDVVLMDISMPAGPEGMDDPAAIPLNGIEATRYIREHFPFVKVLMLTMLDKEQFILEASQAGAHGYVLKTAGHKEILHAIRTLHEGEEYFSPEVARILINRLQSLSPNQNPFLKTQQGSSVTNSPDTGSVAAAQADDSAPLPAGLTRRELEVLQLIAQGYTTIDIAERLFNSRRTIETHRQNLLTKTQCNNTAALIRFAVQQGLVT